MPRPPACNAQACSSSRAAQRERQHPALPGAAEQREPYSPEHLRHRRLRRHRRPYPAARTTRRRFRALAFRARTSCSCPCRRTPDRARRSQARRFASSLQSTFPVSGFSAKILHKFCRRVRLRIADVRRRDHRPVDERSGTERAAEDAARRHRRLPLDLARRRIQCVVGAVLAAGTDDLTPLRGPEIRRRADVRVLAGEAARRAENVGRRELVRPLQLARLVVDREQRVGQWSAGFGEIGPVRMYSSPSFVLTAGVPQMPSPAPLVASFGVAKKFHTCLPVCASQAPMEPRKVNGDLPTTSSNCAVPTITRLSTTIGEALICENALSFVVALQLTLPVFRSSADSVLPLAA